MPSLKDSPAISTSATSPTSPTSPKPRPRPQPLSATRSRPLSTSGSIRSPRLGDDKIERAFDGFFARRQKGLSTAISEVPHEQEVSEHNGEKLLTPRSPLYAPYVEEWPTEPAPLRRPPLYDFFLDLILTAAPLLGIVYAVCAADLNNRPTASNYFLDQGKSWSAHVYGPAMMFAQNLVPTIFPMLAGIEFARFVKAFALFRAERGTRLGYIEQLMGSQSLGGTVASLWSLRIFLNGIGIALFCLWGLLPIGGQAGLRIISSNGTTTKLEQLAYMSTNATPVGFLAENRDLGYYLFSVNGMYSTSMLTPSAATSPQDPWTNVKIPSLEWLERNDGCDSEGWCSIGLAKANSDDDGDALQIAAGTWTSLSGVPVVGGIYGLGVQNFSIETSYYTFDCHDFKHYNPSLEIESALPNRPAHYNTEPGSAIWRNNDSTSSPYTFFIDTDTPVKGVGNAIGDARDNQYDPEAKIEPRNITFGSRSPNSTSIARCGVTMTHVESEVACNFTAPLWNLGLKASGRSAAGACRVNQVRRSLLDKRPEGWTPLDNSWSIPQRFFDSWPGATGNIPSGVSSPTERFINDLVSTVASSDLPRPLAAVNWAGYAPVRNAEGVATNDYVDLVEHLTPQQFTDRFALLFNTYWHAFCNLQAITETEIGLGFNETMPSTLMFNQTATTMQLPGQFYVVHWGYLALFVLCTMIALVAGLLAMLLKYNTRIPDILGSVSTMTRENPYTPVPEGGSTLDGAEYARHVMHMPVRIVDTSPNDEVGHIALSSIDGVDNAEDEKKRPRKGRLYI